MDEANQRLAEAQAVNAAAEAEDEQEHLPAERRTDYLALTFALDAGETFDGFISGMGQYTVDLYPEDGGLPVEGILVGVEPDAEWYGTIQYREHDEDWYPVGPVKTMRVKRVHIH